MLLELDAALDAAASQKRDKAASDIRRLKRRAADGEAVDPNEVLSALDRAGETIETFKADVAKLKEQDRRELVDAEKQEREAADALAAHDRKVDSQREPLSTLAESIRRQLGETEAELSNLDNANRPVRQGLYADWIAAQTSAGHLRHRLAVATQRQLEAKQKASTTHQAAAADLERAKANAADWSQHCGDLRRQLASLERARDIEQAQYDQTTRAIHAGAGNAGDGGLFNSFGVITAPSDAPIKKLAARIAALKPQLERAERSYTAANQREAAARSELERIDAELAKAD